ncbi:MAG: hypothetical protein HY698_04745 [Deltaproteobacteria bacterium]|nr:hypothetical protein [Deltaproteobacteria bacterium]
MTRQKTRKPRIAVRPLADVGLRQVTGGGIAACPGDCNKLTVVTSAKEQLTIVVN